MSQIEDYFDRWTLDNLKALLDALTAERLNKNLSLIWKTDDLPQWTVVSRINTNDEGTLVVVNKQPFDLMKKNLEAGLEKLRADADEPVIEIVLRALFDQPVSDEERELFENWKDDHSSDDILALLARAGREHVKVNNLEILKSKPRRQTSGHIV